MCSTRVEPLKLNQHRLCAAPYTSYAHRKPIYKLISLLPKPATKTNAMKPFQHTCTEPGHVCHFRELAFVTEEAEMVPKNGTFVLIYN
jgi:hypothetical protein